MARKLKDSQDNLDNLSLTDFSQKQREKLRQEKIKRERNKKNKDKFSLFD